MEVFLELNESRQRDRWDRDMPRNRASKSLLHSDGCRALFFQLCNPLSPLERLFLFQAQGNFARKEERERERIFVENFDNTVVTILSAEFCSTARRVIEIPSHIQLFNTYRSMMRSQAFQFRVKIHPLAERSRPAL